MLLQTLVGLVCALVATSALAPAHGTVERRAPAMGFMGMRGKKDALSDGKRAPAMGFMGMRGKKDDLLDSSPEVFSDDKRAMGFMGMRGKKDTDFDYDLEYPGDKRAPLGFQGVRGKKDDYFKRAMGFVGMRGKKEDYPDQELSEDEYWPTDDFDKRAPSSGFFGMRGKKEPSSSSFFGMRGKKNPYGFYGTRGKKVPMSGFIGVRGKKSDNGELEALLSVLVDRQGGDSSKRAPTPYNYRNFADSAFSVAEGRPDSVSPLHPEFCQ